MLTLFIDVKTIFGFRDYCDKEILFIFGLFLYYGEIFIEKSIF